MLKHADGSPKGVDEYRLAALFNAVITAAKRPTVKEMIALKINTLNYVFNWQNSFPQNM